MKILQSIAALFIAALMLFSTTGVRISQHWCGDRLVNATIWGDAEPCAHFKSEGKPACPMHKNQSKKKNCCNEREVIVESAGDDFSASAFYLQAPFVKCVPLLTAMVIEPVAVVTTPKKYYNHSPPLIGPPLYVKVQSFLI